MADRLIAGSDHAGLLLRAEAVKVAREAGLEVEDLGPFSSESVDYPDYARKVGEAVGSGRARLGVLVCGSGIGMSIAANKVPGVRAALCTTEYEARMARLHNDANVLCIGERVVGLGLGGAIVKAFLETRFEGGRHARRVEKMMAMEKERSEG
ncbi:MAG TPA: ribose 5-phosphate isomerase B [Anaeromyxobacter sp.]|nr:ribose 5-phosphate isomerase B [Anaeromyxobacter sp.]